MIDKRTDTFPTVHIVEARIECDDDDLPRILIARVRYSVISGESLLLNAYCISGERNGKSVHVDHAHATQELNRLIREGSRAWDAIEHAIERDRAERSESTRDTFAELRQERHQ